MTTISAATAAIDNITLESVQKAFNHWRSVPGHQKKIPEYLWQQVEKIIPHYRQCKILSALKLGHHQLRKNLNSTVMSQRASIQVSDKKQPVIQTTSPFVKAFLSPPESRLYQVEWQRPNGDKLTITHLDTPGLSLLIQNWRV